MNLMVRERGCETPFRRLGVNIDIYAPRKASIPSLPNHLAVRGGTGALNITENPYSAQVSWLSLVNRCS